MFSYMSLLPNDVQNMVGIYMRPEVYTEINQRKLYFKVTYPDGSQIIKFIDYLSAYELFKSGKELHYSLNSAVMIWKNSILTISDIVLSLDVSRKIYNDIVKALPTWELAELPNEGIPSLIKLCSGTFIILKALDVKTLQLLVEISDGTRIVKKFPIPQNFKKFITGDVCYMDADGLTIQRHEDWTYSMGVLTLSKSSSASFYRQLLRFL